MDIIRPDQIILAVHKYLIWVCLFKQLGIKEKIIIKEPNLLRMLVADIYIDKGYKENQDGADQAHQKHLILFSFSNALFPDMELDA